MTEPLVACEHVTVAYSDGTARIEALRDVSLTLGSGQTLALWGRSGSGKTTLLHALGGLLTPTSGTVSFEGLPLSSLDTAARGRARARGLAYVFQGAKLLPHFTAEENLAFARRAAHAERPFGLGPRELLELVGLAGKAEALPAELSGGESQRVAIARALSMSPSLLLCDEPTGQLDSDTGARVLDLIEACRREFGFAFVIATHDEGVAGRAARRLTLRDGAAVGEVVPA